MSNPFTRRLTLHMKFQTFILVFLQKDLYRKKSSKTPIPVSVIEINRPQESCPLLECEYESLTQCRKNLYKSKDKFSSLFRGSQVGLTSFICICTLSVFLLIFTDVYTL